MSDAIHRRADLVQKPAGTPAGFALAQAICEERAEFDTPFAESFVTDLLGRAGGAIPERPGNSKESGDSARRRAG